jgi:hypothetical protein
MTNLRRQAIGRQCQIRLVGCQSEPVCLCHWRQSGISGIGIKSPDLLGAWGCSACHDQVDRAGRGDPNVQLAFAQGVFRTQAILIREGIVTWGRSAA